VSLRRDCFERQAEVITSLKEHDPRDPAQNVIICRLIVQKSLVEALPILSKATHREPESEQIQAV